MKIANKRITAFVLAAVSVLAMVAPASLADDYAYVNAEHLNVRSLGSVRGKIAAIVDKGYRVTVLETLSNNWKRVLLENGQEGYVNGKYLSDEVPYYEKVSATQYAVKVPHAFVRSDGLNKKIAVVDSGDQLEAVSDRVYFGRWIRVRVLSSANEGYVGRVGYISKHLVSPVEGYQFAEEATSMEEDAAMTDDSEEEVVPEDLDSAGAEETSEGTEEAVSAESESSSEDEDLSKLLEGL